MDYDENVPIILGRPFLATGGALIDVANGRITLQVGNDKEEIKIYDVLKRTMYDDSCYRIDLFDDDFDDEIDEATRMCQTEILSNDPLESVLSMSKNEENREPEVRELVASINGNGDCNYVRHYEDLGEPKKKPLPSSEEPPKPELKQLPAHLKYAFLGENETFPVIISSALTSLQEKKLLEILKENKEAIAWSIADIKGISPKICTHKILMEENHKTSVEPQRRLNPNMKEVVKEEILKLLDAGIIYPISDSPWVSPVQVVPKK